MRDLNRKVDKYIKTKSDQKNKSKPMTPHVTYGISSPTTAATTSNQKKVNSRNFSMTVSFYNPRFESKYPKDYSIKHENSQFKKLQNTSPDRIRSPRRDPILQDGDEPVNEWKTCVKRLELSGKMTMFTEEPHYSRKKHGEFYELHTARSLSPKCEPRMEGIRTGIATHRDYSPDVFPRRLRKEIQSPNINKPNPITEGDLAGIKLIKVRTAPGPSEETKKFNDRKAILGADRGASPKGKVFWDSSIALGSNPLEGEVVITKIAQRLKSPKNKPKDSLKGVIEYEDGPAFKEQTLSPKCTAVPYKELISARSYEE